MNWVIKYLYYIFLGDNYYPVSYFGLSPGHMNYLATSMSWVIKHLYYTFLGDRQNYQPFGAVGHLMDYHPRLSALGDNSSDGS